MRVEVTERVGYKLQDSDARRKKRRADGESEKHETGGEANNSIIQYQPLDIAAFFQNLLTGPTEPRPATTTGLEEIFEGFNIGPNGTLFSLLP